MQDGVRRPSGSPCRQARWYLLALLLCMAWSMPAQPCSLGSPNQLRADGCTAIVPANQTYDTGTVALAFGHAFYATGAGVIVATAGGLQLRTGGAEAYGIEADSKSSVTVDGASIAITGANSRGAVARSGSSVSLANTTIDGSVGDRQVGAQATTGGAVQLTGVNVNMSGTGAYGVAANGVESVLVARDVTIHMSGARSTTGATGVVSENGADVLVIGASTITTVGDDSYGAFAQPAGVGTSRLAIDGREGRVEIRTSGLRAHALFSRSTADVLLGTQIVAVTNGDDAEGARAETGGRLLLVNGLVQTRGANAAGFHAIDAGSQLVSQGAGISTLGSQSHGLFAESGGGVEVGNAAVITSGAGSSAMYVTGVGSYGLADSARLNTQGNAAHGVMLEDGGTMTLRGSSVRAESPDSVALMIHGGAPISLSATDTSFASSGTTLAARNGSGVLNLSGVTMTDNNGVLADLDAGSVLALSATAGSRLAGDVTGAGRLSVTLDAGSAWTGGGTNLGDVTLGSGSEWNVTRASAASALTLAGGTLTFAPPAVNGFKTLSVGTLRRANSSGLFAADARGSTLVLNAVLNEGGAGTQADELRVGASASGVYRLLVQPAGGTGALTSGDGIRLVHIGAASPDVAFKLANGPLQAGAYEYFLFRGGSSGADDYFLRTNFANPGQRPEPSYRPAAIGYMYAPALMREFGFATLGTVHERVGDAAIAIAEGNASTSTRRGWARAAVQTLDQRGGGASYNSTMFSMQGGVDVFRRARPDGSGSQAGVTLRLGSIDTSTSYAPRTRVGLGASTGSISTSAISHGGYYTHYLGDGTYVDLAGEFNYFEHQYQDVYATQARQNGYGVTVSAETGKPLPIGNIWRLEPQLQIAYQFLHASSFGDAISQVSGGNDNAVRGRLGLRLFRDGEVDNPEAGHFRPYMTVDVLRDFTPLPVVSMADASLRPDLARNWWQAGAGVTLQMTKAAHLFTDLKYQHAFGSGRDGLAFRAGMSWRW